MLCDSCNDNPAVVHITKVVNGHKEQLNLCEDCAREYHEQWTTSFYQNFNLPKFLAGLMEPAFNEQIAPDRTGELRCSHCGLSLSQFGQAGKLGCDHCYAEFQEQLNPLIRKIHGSVRHAGKVPKRSGGGLRLRHEIEELRSRLQDAIAREEYEQAAELRDKIRMLEKQL